MLRSFDVECVMDCRSAVSILVLFAPIFGCTGKPSPSAPPTDHAIVGTWRFAKAGEHPIPFPFLIEFRGDGRCNSGPTPHTLMQRSTYTFDGTRIVITHEGEEIVMADVHINGRTMTIPAEDGGEPILLTYERIWPP